MDMPSLWLMRTDPMALWDYQQILRPGKGLLNYQEFSISEYWLCDALHVLTSDDVPLPPDFPRLRLAMPGRAFAPDYFSHGRYDIVSQRLKEAMAQPEGVVQFFPIELVKSSPKAKAQNYQLMRVIAQQSAMDLERTECRLEDFTNRITGVTSKVPRNISRMVLRDDLRPSSEIFRIEESSADVLASDALALRVLRAGCTGIEFRDPSDKQGGKTILHIRTVDGITERRVGFLE